MKGLSAGNYLGLSSEADLGRTPADVCFAPMYVIQDAIACPESGHPSALVGIA
jgi:hypothetical protein